MNILITSYYGLRESLELASNSLSDKGFVIFDYPLLQKYNELKERTCEDMTTVIKDNNINYVLWWFYTIPTDIFAKIAEKNKNVKNILFNWDEPFNWEMNDNKNKAQYFDTVFVTCRESCNWWKKNGTRQAYCLYPGFSKDVHQPIFDENDDDFDTYGCDISICCTNMYDNIENDSQYIKRKELIDNIYGNQEKYGYKLKIFGPNKFKDIYPSSYVKFVNYYDTVKIFHYSKINICTHVLGNMDGYLNERVFLILASGGLLFVDNVKGIDNVLKGGENCVIIDKHNYISQIRNILDNYDDYFDIKFNGLELSSKYNWDEWASFIHDKLTN